MDKLKEFWKDSSVDEKIFAFLVVGFGFPIVTMLFVVVWIAFFSMIASFL